MSNVSQAEVFKRIITLKYFTNNKARFLKTEWVKVGIFPGPRAHLPSFDPWVIGAGLKSTMLCLGGAMRFYSHLSLMYSSGLRKDQSGSRKTSDVTTLRIKAVPLN